MEKQLKTAIIGTGNMGRKYADMIISGEVKGLRLTAVVCRSDEAYEWGKSLGVEVYRNADELFAHADVYDALIIATPHKTHPELALRAFELGKHVMCDKPAGIYARDAKQMYETAREKGLVYALMFHQRMRPEYQKLKDMVENGEFGIIRRILMVNTRYFRTKAYHSSSAWRSSLEGEGGGALINQGQHILDIWQWLFGLPDELQSCVMTGKYNDFDVEDEASILMRYKDGKTGCFIITTAEGAYEEKLIVSGSKKSAVLDGGKLTVTTFSEDTDEYRKRAKCHAREELTQTEEEVKLEKISDWELYVRMLDNFANAVFTGEKLKADGKDGIGTLLLTNGAYISEKEGRRIKLDSLY
ncbi:MAG: Gfo/Idh/MocA family oxidoreductase [Firmicutes bacterium]|nr:Gfo/Idh/MocA family oxidoreductase [Bacillota bacterium]MBQ9605304.1 Gfo/Idh/MocA family oxidoreductase [Bacillota bacterium]